ncbi:TetR family transcriptional regulator [Microbacterium sp. 179-I 1D1 NHS]|uniref:TetR family transcriptional regulator n=1 Tax=Microbacterium sp. 179-I 1D1 NHS TaxID=3374298 RepID=UPI0038794509
MTPPDSNRSPRPPRRTREDVVEAAVDLLDRVGLPDLSMRRLADELGVQPSALYWHVASKQELLAAVSARILTPVALRPSDPEGLAEAAVTLGHRLHDRLLAHRDGAEVVSSSLALGLVASPLHEALSGREESAAAHVVADAVTHYVVGITFHEQQRRSADAWGAAAPEATVTPASFERQADDAFSAALALIVGGIAVWQDGTRRPADA